jgi:predicted DsbA family dithiol-disulfide isomerase
MHDRLFENFKSLEPLAPHADAVGLDTAKFEECMTSERYAQAVRKDMAEAGKAGATGTPSFILGLTDPDDPRKVKGVSFLRGAQPYPAFKGAIDAALEDLEGE